MRTLNATIHLPPQRRKDGRDFLGQLQPLDERRGHREQQRGRRGEQDQATDRIVTVRSAQRHMLPVGQQAQLPDTDAGHGEKDSDENPQRLAVDHFAFPVAFFSGMGLGRPIPTVSAKASSASSSTETFSM